MTAESSAAYFNGASRESFEILRENVSTFSLTMEESLRGSFVVSTNALIIVLVLSVFSIGFVVSCAIVKGLRKLTEWIYRADVFHVSVDKISAINIPAKK